MQSLGASVAHFECAPRVIARKPGFRPSPLIGAQAVAPTAIRGLKVAQRGALRRLVVSAEVRPSRDASRNASPTLLASVTRPRRSLGRPSESGVPADASDRAGMPAVITSLPAGARRPRARTSSRRKRPARLYSTCGARKRLLPPRAGEDPPPPLPPPSETSTPRRAVAQLVRSAASVAKLSTTKGCTLGRVRKRRAVAPGGRTACVTAGRASAGQGRVVRGHRGDLCDLGC